MRVLNALPNGAAMTSGPHRFATADDPTSLVIYALGERRFEVHQQYRVLEDGRLGFDKQTVVVELDAEVAP